MSSCDSKITGSGSIRFEIVRDELVWDKAILLQKLAHEFQRRTLVPSALNQHTCPKVRYRNGCATEARPAGRKRWTPTSGSAIGSAAVACLRMRGISPSGTKPWRCSGSRTRKCRHRAGTGGNARKKNLASPNWTAFCRGPARSGANSHGRRDSSFPVSQAGECSRAHSRRLRRRHHRAQAAASAERDVQSRCAHRAGGRILPSDLLPTLFALFVAAIENPTSHRGVAMTALEAARLMVFASHLFEIVERRTKLSNLELMRYAMPNFPCEFEIPDDL
jgi:hypothetical protein